MFNDETNLEHATNPQPGDYWSEMIIPICVVIATMGNLVIYCSTKKDSEDGKGQTWDLEKLQSKTRDEFKKWVCYGSEAMSHKTWCDVRPNEMMWAVEKASQLTPKAS